MTERKGEGSPHKDAAGWWRDALGGDDNVLERLEMVALLRSGTAPDEIARRFLVDEKRLYQLNERFSLAGVAGLLSEGGPSGWLDGLDRDEPLLRRLDMIRLVRSGTPIPVVARQYNALDEYVERLCARFSRDGVAGILTDDDFDRFRAVHPPVIRVCSFNLHGTHDNVDGGRRFRRIARELGSLDPHVAAFQEVLSGGGVEDTSAQISRWITSVTGCHYRSRFLYCHSFMEKYPEGVALCFRRPAQKVRSIDLTRLPGDLRPALPRNALVADVEIYGRKVTFASVHLDHSADSTVRLAQAEKLVSELGAGESDCSILAGDFNDLEDSPAIRYLVSAGYVDAYRACHEDEGPTYPAGGPNMRIDYIFVKGHTTIAASGLLADDPELSDHIAIFAEIV